MDFNYVIVYTALEVVNNVTEEISTQLVQIHYAFNVYVL